MDTKRRRFTPHRGGPPPTQAGPERIETLIAAYISSLGKKEGVLTDIKRAVRTGGDKAAERIVCVLVDDTMTQSNAVARFHSLELTRVLFERSAAFRANLVSVLPRLLERALGLNGVVVPGPQLYRDRCRDLAIQLIADWHSRFGVVLPQLDIARYHLKKLKLFINTNTANTREARDARMRADRIKRERHEAYLATVQDMDEKLSEILENMSKIRALFGILIVNFEEPATTSEPAGVSTAVTELSLTHKGMAKAYGLGSTSYSLEITIPNDPASLADPETEENKILYDSLRECRKLQERHLALVNAWSKVISVEDTEIREIVAHRLRRVIDLKLEMEDLRTKTNVLISTAESKSKLAARAEVKDDDSDDEFADEIFEEVVLSHGASSSTAVPAKRKIGIEPGLNLFQSVRWSSSAAVGSSSQNSPTLLAANSSLSEIIHAAPVVPFNQDLYYWDKKEVQFNTTGINFHHRFLGEGTGENVIPDAAMADLRTRLVVVEPEKVEIAPCRAKLKNGNLCPRRDRLKCPLHGVIVPRDDFGVPLNPSHNAKRDAAPSVPLWQELERDVNASVGSGSSSTFGTRKGPPKTALQEELDVLKKKDSVFVRLEKAFKASKKK
ncbi:hypothetical protein BC830DRAFT_1112533 [Chytriomyces sp. MP71]|nr:hypothetical protein BC830DRAFT_1112533 [Chytriomyces sp. MP71]